MRLLVGPKHSFKASSGWLFRFVQRKKLAIRRRSNAKSASIEERIPYLQRYFARTEKRLRSTYPLADILLKVSGLSFIKILKYKILPDFLCVDEQIDKSLVGESVEEEAPEQVIAEMDLGAKEIQSLSDQDPLRQQSSKLIGWNCKFVSMQKTISHVQVMSSVLDLNASFLVCLSLMLVLMFAQESQMVQTDADVVTIILVLLR
eukprot:Pompholyxophrys_sp_v1_NODE_12_length_5133_cov_3.790272.p1 type:complete len:204 gc:universal NODE_12_length_5133_cov_3.790272:539-1150(+)